jgi:putative peptide zinc metalloprotease protein
VWVDAEPGVIRTIAFNTMLIGGVTTLLFNGNPLLRFDGYYILADLAQIPNLRSRSNGFISYLFERHVLAHRSAERPETTPGEPAWFVGYAVSAFIYRLFVVVAIFLFVLDLSLLLGMLMVTMSMVGWVVMPIVKGVRYLLVDSATSDVRGRAWAVLCGGAAAVALLLFIIPMPYRTQTEGVVWLPEEALLRAGADGFIERIVAEPGARTQPGQLLIDCRDPDLDTEVAVLTARLRMLNARYHEELVASKVRAQIVDEERIHVTKRLARASERQSNLLIRSSVEGTFLPIQPADLPGRFVRQGQPVAHLLQDEAIRVRAVVPEDHIELVRLAGTIAEVRLSNRVNDVLPARIDRIVPAASERLPSTALGSSGGGEVAVDPRDERGVQAVGKYFMVELELSAEHVSKLGARVYVRFAHPRRPLASQWYRSVRQIFLSRLDV